MRYTECRMAPSARAMTAGLDEDTVDFRPNYDGKETEPSVLPSGPGQEETFYGCTACHNTAPKRRGSRRRSVVPAKIRSK